MEDLAEGRVRRVHVLDDEVLFLERVEFLLLTGLFGWFGLIDVLPDLVSFNEGSVVFDEGEVVLDHGGESIGLIDTEGFKEIE